MSEKSLARFHEEFSKIREIDKCRTCICFYETLKIFDDELDMLRRELREIREACHRWWKEREGIGVHDCLGCNPCLPVEAYNEFCKSLGKKAYCPVCGEEIE